MKHKLKQICVMQFHVKQNIVTQKYLTELMLAFFVYEEIVLFALRHQYMRTSRKKPRKSGDRENVRKLQKCKHFFKL